VLHIAPQQAMLNLAHSINWLPNALMITAFNQLDAQLIASFNQLKSTPTSHNLFRPFLNPLPYQPSRQNWDLLQPIRQWLNQLNVQDIDRARWLCRTIPVQCPFARKIRLSDTFTIEIPPLCKLNPLYDEIIGLRFRALCYLADECGLDVSEYC
jgi:hypothetical protein